MEFPNGSDERKKEEILDALKNDNGTEEMQSVDRKSLELLHNFSLPPGWSRQKVHKCEKNMDSKLMISDNSKPNPTIVAIEPTPPIQWTKKGPRERSDVSTKEIVIITSSDDEDIESGEEIVSMMMGGNLKTKMNTMEGIPKQKKVEKSLTSALRSKWSLASQGILIEEPSGSFGKERLPSMNSDKEAQKRSRFSLTLSKKEIEEDFLKMTGKIPSKRPKRRPEIVEKNIKPFFPGNSLTEVKREMYKFDDEP